MPTSGSSSTSIGLEDVETIIRAAPGSSARVPGGRRAHPFASSGLRRRPSCAAGCGAQGQMMEARTRHGRRDADDVERIGAEGQAAQLLEERA